MVEALMKQILVAALRGHLAREADGSPFSPLLSNSQLGRAVAAIVAKPADPHSSPASLRSQA